MINYRSLVYPSLFVCLFFVSCFSRQQAPDAPAYHNPLVQPITDALNNDPDNPQLLYQRSLALLQLNELKLARKDLQQALQKDSNNLQYLFTLSQIQLQTGDNVAAIKNLERLNIRSPKAGTIQLALAKAYLQNNQPERAAQNINNLLKADSAFPGALLSLSRIQLIKKDTDNAIVILKRALQLRENNYSASLLLAECLAAKNSPLAIEAYRQTFAMDTTDVSPLLHIGMYYDRIKQREKAKGIYRECLQKDPDCTAALINTGKILLSQDSVQKALRQINIAIKTQPNSAEAYIQKGICFEKMKQNDSAKVAYGQALVFDPQSTIAKEGWQRN